MHHFARVLLHVFPISCALALAGACSSSESGTTPTDGGSSGPNGDNGGGDDGSASPGSDGGSSSGGKDGGGSGGGKDSGGGTKDSGPPPPPNDGGGLPLYGPVHTGGEYDLGPVEWTGSFWNQCGPYVQATETAEGVYLAGLDSTNNGNGSLCDACMLMWTPKGKSIVLRVITGGQARTKEGADISQEAFNVVNVGENPRSMSWQLVKCPDTGKIQYQYQTQANVDWTSLWVRNARAPLSKIEVMSSKHATWFALTRGTDGTLTDTGGFGSGAFQIRLTAMDGTVITDSFPSFSAGALVTSPSQF
jgi:hypothetical protein